MHLIADMAVPAHTRNAPHCPDSFEAWVGANANLVAAFLANPITPDPQIFSIGVPIPDEIAKVPVARLWDTDTYDGTNPNATLFPAIGLAEYTNANFFSDNTIGGDFPYPLRTSLMLRPNPEPAPLTLELRLYLRKGGDGETVEFAGTPSALASFVPNDLASSRIGLDDAVLADYARHLLPRAAGYASTLLDYFFRGKLDVTLIGADATDPSVVRISGTNASTEALDGGMLGLYADDASGARTMLAALDDASVVGVDAGDPVLSARFRVPVDAERFVAVYKGALGGESGSPGAVIGKVLGGVRVEQIFNNGVTWRLRTPAGVFDLPLKRSEYEMVKWGDGDNVLVGRTALTATGANHTNRFTAWDVIRKPGSGDPDLDPSTGVVRLVAKSDVLFPDGADAGTTVNASAQINYAQTLPRMTVITDSVEMSGTCVGVTQTFSPLSFEKVVSRSLPFSVSFPLRVDMQHNASVGTMARPYTWRLLDFGADTTGRIVALVRLDLTDPGWPGAAVPVLVVDATGALVESSKWSPNVIRPRYPHPSTVFALLDVGAGRTIASTAEPTITMSFTNAVGPGTIFGYGIAIHGIQNGCQPLDAWAQQERSPYASAVVPDEIVEIAGVSTYTATVEGYVRHDLAAARS